MRKGLTIGLAAVALATVGMATTNETSTSKTGDGAMQQVRDYIQKKAIDTSAANWRTKLPTFPDVTFGDGKTYTWRLKTNKGEIEIELLTEAAPKHVANFLYLTELGFFDGLSFHRVIPGFMAQGGCPLGTGTGDPGYRFQGEFSSGLKHDTPGLLSMANAGPGTDGSQFFITFVPTPWLDGKHTLFGRVTKGQATLKALEARGSSPAGRTTEKLVLEKAAIVVGE
jgi:cyclophilin family peptidyl-prolyl cis-trans isomerase